MMKPKYPMTVGVDFDNTIAAVGFEHPQIGYDLGAISWLQMLMYHPDVELILWTARERFALDAAVKWCADRGLTFAGANEAPSQEGWLEDCRKVHFALLIDDHALGVPIKESRTQWAGQNTTFVVDWTEAGPMVMENVARWLERHSV